MQTTGNDWLYKNFLVPKDNISRIKENNVRFFTSAGTKLQNGSLLGSLAINGSLTYTHTADIPVMGLDRQQAGAGRMWSEQEDGDQYIHMRFGVPQFTAMATFFGPKGFYNSEAAIVARTGRSPNGFYYLTKAAGSIITLPLAPIIGMGKLWRFVTNRPSSRYYNLKPSMHQYYNSVNMIFNTILMTEGVLPSVRNAEQMEQVGDQEGFSPSDINGYATAMSRYMPGVFKRSGGIDVFAYASRMTRKAIALREDHRKMMESVSSVEEYEAKLSDYIEFQQFVPPRPTFTDENGEHSIQTATEAYENTDYGRLDTQDSELTDTEGNPIPTAPIDTIPTEEDPGLSEHAEAFFKDGGEFITFKVNHTGGSSESFSNDVGQSELQEMINGFSAGIRSKTFSLAGGNLVAGMGNIVEGVTQAAQGLASGLKLDGVVGLLGSGYADLPQEWKDATADLPKMSYSIQLRSDAADPISRAFNLWLPLSFLLAAVLPRSVGKQAYTAPFLCELYDKGRAQTRLGVVTSLSVKRGEGNIGWTDDHKPLGIDVDFEVSTLDNLIHMPISTAPELFDADNAFSDYISVLASLSLEDQYFLGNRFRIRMARMMDHYEKYTSPAYYSSMIASSTPGKVARTVTRAFRREVNGVQTTSDRGNFSLDR